MDSDGENGQPNGQSAVSARAVTGAREPATVVDVARLAGVSRQTVSRVLNDSPTVTPSTRERVLEAMRALGYKRNEVASSLRTGRTRTLGLLLANVMNPALATELRAIQDTVERQGYRVVVYNTDESVAKEQRYLEILREQRVDGILLVEVGQEAERQLSEQRAENPPMVVLNRCVSSMDSVSIESGAGVCHATMHLLAHGHERIGLVLATQQPESNPRVTGYREALDAADLPADDALVAATFDVPEAGRAATLRLLDLDRPPSALIAVGNMVTLGALMALRERGLRVGRDIGLISDGFNSWAPFLDPPLTTVSVDPYRLGSEGAQVLLDRLRGGLTPAPVQRMLTFAFEVRGSCGDHEPDGTPRPGGSR